MEGPLRSRYSQRTTVSHSTKLAGSRSGDDSRSALRLPVSPTSARTDFGGRYARYLKEASWGDSEVIQVMGWSPKGGQKMLRRFVGDYTTKHLASPTTTFERTG